MGNFPESNQPGFFHQPEKVGKPFIHRVNFITEFILQEFSDLPYIFLPVTQVPYKGAELIKMNEIIGILHSLSEPSPDFAPAEFGDENG